MNTPRQPRLPKTAPEPSPTKPHPLHHPDERKEGGPDFGKESQQHRKADHQRDEAHREAVKKTDSNA